MGCDVAVVLAVTTPPSPGLSTTLVKRALTTVVGVPLFVWLVIGAPRWVFALLVVASSALAAWELMRMFERAGRPGYARLAVVGAGPLRQASSRPDFPCSSFALTSSRPDPECALCWIRFPPWNRWRSRCRHRVHRLAPRARATPRHAAGRRSPRAPPRRHDVGGRVCGVHRRLGPRTPSVGPGDQPAQDGRGRRRAARRLHRRRCRARGMAPAAVVDVDAIWPAGSSGIAGQIGDLRGVGDQAESGCQGTGGLIPGHGGVLDRLDGLLFNAPALFYYASWVGGRG